MNEGRVVCSMLAFAAFAQAQDAPPEASRGLPSHLAKSLEALGASNGVPDGLGFEYAPSQFVRGQNARLGFQQYSAGATVPLYEGAASTLFANVALRTLSVTGRAILPDSHVAFPGQLWDVQFGGTYINQLDAQRSWGVNLNIGTISDRPFGSPRDGVTNFLGFYRTATSDKTAWMILAVSTTNGQVGGNIPIPGIAYEFEDDRLSGIVGFPFVSLQYKWDDRWKTEFSYTALTDVLARQHYRFDENWRTYSGFQWTNQSWFRHDRRHPRDQLFRYEKRVESGLVYQPHAHVTAQCFGGFAFDRYFVENNGFSLSGRNRIDLRSGPYIGLQVEIVY